MRNFKNNYRRNRYKNHSDRNHHKNGNASKIINDLQNGSDFVRKIPGRNNHNASKLIEKYSSLAREALSNGDKILSENYFQHADHFTRVQNEHEKNRIARINTPKVETVKPISTKVDVSKSTKSEEVIKTSDKKIAEKEEENF